MPEIPLRSIDPEKLRRIEQERIHLQRVTELRLKLLQRKESCHLVLAGALLKLRSQYGLTWADIANLITGISDKGHAHRIANRQMGVSYRSYQLITSSINQLFYENGDALIAFPEYPEPF